MHYLFISYSFLLPFVVVTFIFSIPQNNEISIRFEKSDTLLFVVGVHEANNTRRVKQTCESCSAPIKMLPLNFDSYQVTHRTRHML